MSEILTLSQIEAIIASQSDELDQQMAVEQTSYLSQRSKFHADLALVQHALCQAASDEERRTRQAQVRIIENRGYAIERRHARYIAQMTDERCRVIHEIDSQVRDAENTALRAVAA